MPANNKKYVPKTQKPFSLGQKVRMNARTLVFSRRVTLSPSAPGTKFLDTSIPKKMKPECIYRHNKNETETTMRNLVIH
jgi:hypothetical protein